MKSIIKILLQLSLFTGISACTSGSGGNDIDIEENGEKSTFTKNVLITEFISFDCVYCPKVHRQLNEASTVKHPGRIDLISMHGRLNEADPMEFSAYKAFQNYFYGVTGYPAVIFDQRDDLTTVGNFDVTEAKFIQRLNAETSVGIALNSSTVNDKTLKLDVNVSNKGNTNADYRLAVAVLENNITYRQADWINNEISWIENYNHNHVLRSILSENYFGDSIGELKKGSEYKRSFTYQIPEGYKKDNLIFVVYIIEAKGFAGREVVNSRTAKIGETVNFY